VTASPKPGTAWYASRTGPHRRQLLLLRQRSPDHRAATRTRRPARRASAGLAALPRLATSPPAAMPRRSPIAASIKSRDAQDPVPILYQSSSQALITVTHDDSGDSGRDHRTGTSPILGKRSFPLVSTLNRALAVSQMACRRSYGTGTGAGRPSAPSACRRRRRRSSGTRRSGPPGPAGAPRQIPHRAKPAPGWPWPRSAAPAGAPLSVQRRHIEHRNRPA